VLEYSHHIRGVATKVELEFSAIEIRVLACLVEKESTTPESYPLTLNSLTRAANQLSNREPVMKLSEMEVQESLDSLSRNMLVSTRSSSEGRVIKYSHRLRDRRTPEFDFEQPELAVIAILLLRGPQTLGEIRTRTARIHQFNDMQELSASINKLSEGSDGPYVKQLSRHPGQKEARYTHLFAGDVEENLPPDYSSQSAESVKAGFEQSEVLEQRVKQLEEELSSLQDEFQTFVKQFE
jgi:uncharacterized protein